MRDQRRQFVDEGLLRKLNGLLKPGGYAGTFLLIDRRVQLEKIVGRLRTGEIPFDAESRALVDTPRAQVTRNEARYRHRGPSGPLAQCGANHADAARSANNGLSGISQPKAKTAFAVETDRGRVLLVDAAEQCDQLGAG